MGAVAELDFASGTGEFFAPASTDMIDGLVAEYRKARENIDRMSAIVEGDLGSVIHYFIEGNAGDERHHRSLYVDRLFQVPASAKGKDVLPGFACEWSRVFANEFAGTSVDVVILVATQ